VSTVEETRVLLFKCREEGWSARIWAGLTADWAVPEPLRRLAQRYEPAVVSSSALSRPDKCFDATGLGKLIAAGRRHSTRRSRTVVVIA
jgi:hypothetical protein